MEAVPDRNEDRRPSEKPDRFWRKVYLAVIISTFLVVTALWAFSRYFS